MKNENMLIIGIIVLVVAVFAVLVAVNLREGKVSANSAPTTETFEALKYKPITTGTTSSGDVSIELQPHEVENGILIVDLWADTHSVDLSEYDLLQITTLEFGASSISPTTAPALGGHHVSGTLEFEVDQPISSFSIKIKGIPKVQERVFNW